MTIKLYFLGREVSPTGSPPTKGIIHNDFIQLHNEIGTLLIPFVVIKLKIDSSISTIPSSGCENENPSCDQWAKTGECDKNPGYMLISCKKACKVCGK